MSHPLDALTTFAEPQDPSATQAADSRGPRAVTTRTHPAWANMVGPYGGATAAQALGAVTGDPRAQGRPAALTLNFVAPVADGEMSIVVDPVRTNRTNQHWTVRIEQEAGVVLTGTALLATPRDTFSETEVLPPEVPRPEDLEPTSMAAAGLPWMDNYEFRLLQGRPDRPGDSSDTVMWLAQAQPRPWDHLSLAAASDAFFPRIFARTGRMSPAGTITYTAYFHAGPQELAQQGEHLLCRARASRFHTGLFDQVGHVLGEDGSLLATTTQLVYFKGV